MLNFRTERRGIENQEIQHALTTAPLAEATNFCLNEINTERRKKDFIERILILIGTKGTPDRKEENVITVTTTNLPIL
jgi:hypothetical protein